MSILACSASAVQNLASFPGALVAMIVALARRLRERQVAVHAFVSSLALAVGGGGSGNNKAVKQGGSSGGCDGRDKLLASTTEQRQAYAFKARGARFHTQPVQ